MHHAGSHRMPGHASAETMARSLTQEAAEVKPKPSTLNPRHWTLDTDPKSQTLNPRHWTLDPKSQTLDPRP